MVVKDLEPFREWITSSVFSFLIAAAALIVLGCIVGFLGAANRYGPLEAFFVVSRVIFGTIPDVIGTSLRRIMAIASLAIREAISSRYILVAFVIISIAMLVGGWYLDMKSEHPEKVYIGFLGWGTQLMVLMCGLMMSAFSLPADIKNKTIFTVMTKPVRATEVVLGRIVGFVLVGSFLLGVIWIVSYFFIKRGLSHTHVVETDSVTSVIDGKSATGRRINANAIEEGQSSFKNNHRHRVEFFKDDKSGEKYATLKSRMGHSHEVTTNPDGTFSIGASKGNLVARVPIYASNLSFIDRTGARVSKGYNVGNEWDYRSFIEGGTTQSRAIFEFEGLSASQFDEGPIPINFQLSVFRTHKGDIERRINASLYIESLQDDGEYQFETPQPIDVFETEEFAIQTRELPRKIRCIKKNLKTNTSETKEFDLFDDIAANGKMSLILRCNNGGQFIGVAKKDVFFRPRDDWFFTNFAKSYFGIWLQLVIVVTLAVMFSTFLSGNVALIGTIVAVILSFQAGFIKDLAENQVEGGGPIEAMLRMVTQKNVITPLEGGTGTYIIQSLDYLILTTIDGISSIMPDYTKLNFSNFLAEGFSIETERLLVATILTFAFCFICSAIGYYCLKTRELAG